MFSLKIFTTILLTNIFFSEYIVINGRKCNDKDLDDADLCMQKMLMIGDRSQKFRDTLADMHVYCKNITEYQKCVKRFSRECLPGLGRQVTNLMMFGVTKNNKPLCVNDETKTQFATNTAKCGNINIDGKHQCMEDFVADLALTESQTSDKKIPLVCCNFWRFKHCVKQTIDAKRCTKQSTDAILNLISGYTGDALDLICAEYDEGSDKCKKLIIHFNEIKIDGKSGRKVKPKSRSLLPSFIKIFTNL